MIKHLNKRLVLIILLLAVIIVGFLFWLRFVGSNNTVIGQNIYKGEIIVGYTTWPGYLGLYLADSRGYFRDAGLNVVLKHYDSFSEMSDDFVAGKIQGKADVTLDVVSEAISGVNQKIITAIDYSNGADGIVALPGIKMFSDVRGKRVAFEFGNNLEEFFIRYVLEEHGLKLKDIIAVNLTAEKAAQAMIRKEVDVAVTFEPYLSEAIKKSGGNLIYSSEKAPGLIADVLTFKSDFIENNPETIQAVVRAYFRGINFWKNNMDEANSIIGKYQNSTGAEVAEQLKKINVLDIRDNQIAFSFSAGFKSLYYNLRYIADFLTQSNNYQILDTDLLIEDRFIRVIDSEKSSY